MREVLIRYFIAGLIIEVSVLASYVKPQQSVTVCAMWIRRILIFCPIFILVILFQSYFWVPTYRQQTKGNPGRLEEFITASSGDASILNPVLSSDSVSSSIEGLVFEGLIDRNKDLRFRGRIARSWEIYEEAYFYVNESADIPGLGSAGPQALADFLKAAKEKNSLPDRQLRDTLGGIRGISVIPPMKYQATRTLKDPTSGREREIKFTLSPPSRIKLTLDRVNPNLFETLSRLLGKDYFHSFTGRNYIQTQSPLDRDGMNVLADELLPPTEHNPVILFHLRSGVTFHDGHIVDAHDVKFTYASIMDPKNLSPRVSDYEAVKSVAVIAPLTVKVTYKRLFSPAFATWAIGILPEHLLNAQALAAEAVRLGKDPETFSLRQSMFNRHPIGCGPFTFREWKSDQYIGLDRFDDYWEGPANYRRYFDRVIPDLLTQEMEFYAGTLDNYDVQPYEVERLRKSSKYQVFSGTSFGYTYIGYNMRRKPFDDLRVRKALGMAIDVDKIIKYLLYGQGERITGPFVIQTDYYDHRIKPLPYDPEGARALLAEAGWKPDSDGWLEKDGKKLQFTLITNSGNDIRKALLAIAQNAWKRIGIDVRTDLLEWSVFIQERIDKLDFDALILGWQMGIEPDLYPIWHSSQTHPFQLNFVGFKNKSADELIIKIRQTYDHDKQVQYCHRLHEVIAEEQPYTFLYAGKWTAVLDNRIVMKEVDKAGHVVYKKIEPTKTGNYMYDFNKWVKLPETPHFSSNG